MHLNMLNIESILYDNQIQYADTFLHLFYTYFRNYFLFTIAFAFGFIHFFLITQFTIIKTNPFHFIPLSRQQICSGKKKFLLK